jgi:molybdopterin-containing oxidoreductase family iron-sulfur binding subunit
VVEKCTFCVQRVEKGLTTACAATCPVEAILFGDLEDPRSAVNRHLEGREHFSLLEEAGTKPAVRYVGGSPPEARTREIERIKVEVKA